MSLTNFRALGRSGLVVSPLCLGTMTFGPGDWGADEAASREIFNAYRDAGGNFVDTADIYSGGVSEELVGKFIRETKSRDDIVLATKFGFNGSSSPLTGTRAAGAIPMRAGRGPRTFTARWTPRSNGSAPTISTSTGCTSGMGSPRWKRSCKPWAIWCAPARSATTPFPTCPHGSR